MKKNENSTVHKNDALVHLHDCIMENLEAQHKKGVRQLLERNSASFKKILYPYLLMCGVKDVKGLMNAIDGVLEAHTKECYAIGYIDALEGKGSK
jgi:hypothetical protein